MLMYQRKARRPLNSHFEGVLGRVPGRFPAHEVAVADALLVRALAQHREGDIAGMQVSQLADLFRFMAPDEDRASLSPRFNIAPSQSIATVRSEQGDGRELTAVRWGLIPMAQP